MCSGKSVCKEPAFSSPLARCAVCKFRNVVYKKYIIWKFPVPCNPAILLKKQLVLPKGTAGNVLAFVVTAREEAP
jgi:hypothetical protein